MFGVFGEEHLVQANSLNSLSSNFARLAGPALGGLIMDEAEIKRPTRAQNAANCFSLSCSGKEQWKSKSINSEIVIAVHLLGTSISHFNCSITVKDLTSFFRTVFFGRVFCILSSEPVELTRKENTSLFVCAEGGFVGSPSLRGGKQR